MNHPTRTERGFAYADTLTVERFARRSLSGSRTWAGYLRVSITGKGRPASYQIHDCSRQFDVAVVSQARPDCTRDPLNDPRTSNRLHQLRQLNRLNRRAEGVRKSLSGPGIWDAYNQRKFKEQPRRHPNGSRLLAPLGRDGQEPSPPLGPLNDSRPCRTSARLFISDCTPIQSNLHEMCRTPHNRKRAGTRSRCGASLW